MPDSYTEYSCVRPVASSLQRSGTVREQQGSCVRMAALAVLFVLAVCCLTEIRVEEAGTLTTNALLQQQWQKQQLLASRTIVLKRTVTTQTLTVNADGSETTTTTTTTTTNPADGAASGAGNGTENATAAGDNATATAVEDRSVPPVVASEVGCTDPLHCNMVDGLSWSSIPEPRGDQLPLGASRKTWPNIVNNKRTILFCTSFYKYLGNREKCIHSFTGGPFLEWQVSPSPRL